jgi:hypothetical protein
MKSKLRLVDDTYVSRPLAYVVGVDEANLNEAVESLARLGTYSVINGDECDPVDAVHLRTHLSMLAVCDVLVLPTTWWTSATAHQLVNVAAWCGIKLIDANGTEIPTVKKGGKK